ncbi:transporter [Leifsonia shinshuensis]|uniref:SLAC1 family transporter n=1 Tax=Leifsonia shinshuensis TaxID=150026 RepID=UPI002855D4D5|nr:transporter [Leifsonia shinshuensis]MDR6971583.1 tellurite resistance protein [Leifsonia shinshuensis]
MSTTAGDTAGTPARRRSAQRIPLNTLAIAFGLAGLAGVWTTAGRLLGVPELIGQLLWVVVLVAWLWLIVAHLRRGARSAETLAAQLRHPAQGPIAALVPVVGMLLGADLYRFVPVAGLVVVVVSLVVAAGFAGWILAYWHTGSLPPEAFHGGYLLPTVAAGLIGATTSFKVGLPGVAMAAFAVGIFFWVVISTVLLARLAFFPPLPAALTPTCAILLAPPAVAGTAWFTMNGEHADAVSTALLGLLVLMALQQLALITRYRVLPFSLGFWSFTFPVAAAAGYGVEWLSIAGFAGWQLVAWLVVALPTAVVLAVAVRSLVLVTSVRRGARRAESVLRRADAAVERR